MIQPDFLARFTTHLREALQKALAFTIQSGRDLLLPGDVLVGLLQEKGSVAADLLLRANVSLKQAEFVFRGTPVPHEPGSVISPDLSSVVKKLLEAAVLKAHVLEHKYIGTEHLLTAMLEMTLPDVQSFLTEQGIHTTFLRDQLEHVLQSTSKFPDLGKATDEEEHTETAQNTDSPESHSTITPPKRTNEKRQKALELFARELTAPETVAKLDPVIGREQETDRLIEVLCRRSKNNPLLLGEPGVGKTAIVEGLAQRLCEGDVPDLLHGKRVFAIDLALMVAGTMYRGEFEARLKQVVEEAKQDPRVILFIDEIHTIVGAGSTSGSLDAANILKPALSRGEIRCIGATTSAEYKKHIEPDAALERRYQTVEVHEPNHALTLEMISGLKKHYETHHGVSFTKQALEASIEFASKYLTDRFFPDKAIDLLDEAAAHVNAQQPRSASRDRQQDLEASIEHVREKKEEAVQTQNLALADKLKQEEAKLHDQLRVLVEEMSKLRQQKRIVVDRADIAAVVARMTRVPLSTVLATEREQLSALQDRLGSFVVGQPQAIAHVSDTIRKARLGLSDPRRPKASFLFVGPSGVGKTELARQLAKEIFGKEEALIQLDMTEFAEAHSVSKLLGSPAGYVGYREGNKLMDTIRKHPHSVLLFDEFEKAHHDVQHLFLQALEQGALTDSTGKKITLRHAYLVFTSNVGSESINKTGLGFQSSQSPFEQLVREQLAERFRPELLNRLDRVIVFQPLETEHLKQIVKRELAEVIQRIEQTQKIKCGLSSQVIDWLVQRDFDASQGARVARHLVEKEISALLGEALIQKPGKKSLSLKIVKDQLVCR